MPGPLLAAAKAFELVRAARRALAEWDALPEERKQLARDEAHEVKDRTAELARLLAERARAGRGSDDVRGAEIRAAMSDLGDALRRFRSAMPDPGIRAPRTMRFAARATTRLGSSIAARRAAGSHNSQAADGPRTISEARSPPTEREGIDMAEHRPPPALLEIEARWQRSVDKSTGPAGGPHSATSWATILGYGEWGERVELDASHPLWGSVPLEEHEERDGRIPGGREFDNVIFVWDDGRVLDRAVRVSVIEVIPPGPAPTVTYAKRDFMGNYTAVTPPAAPQSPTRVLRHHGETVAEAYLRQRDDPPAWIAWEELRDFWDDPGLSPSTVASCRVAAMPSSTERRHLSVTGRYSPYPSQSSASLLVM